MRTARTRRMSRRLRKGCGSGLPRSRSTPPRSMLRRRRCRSSSTGKRSGWRSLRRANGWTTTPRPSSVPAPARRRRRRRRPRRAGERCDSGGVGGTAVVEPRSAGRSRRSCGPRPRGRDSLQARKGSLENEMQQIATGCRRSGAGRGPAGNAHRRGERLRGAGARVRQGRRAGAPDGGRHPAPGRRGQRPAAPHDGRQDDAEAGDAEGTQERR